MELKTAPCPQCGNQYGPTQMQQRADKSWWCPGCHWESAPPPKKKDN